MELNFDEICPIFIGSKNRVAKRKVPDMVMVKKKDSKGFYVKVFMLGKGGKNFFSYVFFDPKEFRELRAKEE